MKRNIPMGAYYTVIADDDINNAPRINNIHQKVYEATSQPDALVDDACGIPADVYGIYPSCQNCTSPRCRAGWVVHLAGNEGKELDKRMGAHAAASLIYLRSDASMSGAPDFYMSHEDTIADMKRLAEMEKA